MKNKTSISYPVHHGLATSYGFVKRFNPNEEYSAWQKSRSNSKWLLISLFVLLLLFSACIFAFFGFNQQKIIQHRAKEEGKMFMLAMPTAALFFASALVSLSLFEKLYARRKAYRNMKRFAEDYVEFLTAIEATDEEVSRWSDQRVKNACLAILQAERVKIDKMKTSRGKASRLAKLLEIYAHMNNVGIRFESVDTYIRDIKILTKPKPKVSKTKKNTNSKGNVVPFQPAA